MDTCTSEPVSLSLTWEVLCSVLVLRGSVSSPLTLNSTLVPASQSRSNVTKKHNPEENG